MFFAYNNMDKVYLTGGVKMQVGVVMGGVSSEKDISCFTGKHIIDSLNKENYEVLPIPINTKYELIDRVKCLEFALIALHGNFGEDGKTQAILESIGVPYSGSGVLSSSLCMDKNISKKILISERINTPKWIMVNDENNIDYKEIEKIGYPLIVKPNDGGSSIGISLVDKKDDLKNAIKEALKYCSEVMIEEFISGEEFTCCMLDGKLLPIISIKTKDKIFSYEDKYKENGAEEKVVNLKSDLQEQIEKVCKICWNTFKLDVYATIDIIIKDNIIYVIEINTLPGMTENSLFPKSAKAYGLNFNELLDCIIKLSLNKK